MKKIIVVLFWCFVQFSMAQIQPVKKINDLIDSIKILGLTNKNKTELYFKKAKSIANRNNLKESYFNILKNEASFYSVTGNMERVLILSDSLINQSINENCKANGYLEKGIVLIRKNKLDDAIFNLRKALKIYERINDIKGIAHVFKLLGNASFMNTNMLESREFYKKAIDLMFKNSDSLAAANTYTNLSRTYEVYNEIDSAFFYNNIALKIVEIKKDITELGFTAYLNDANYNSKLGKFEIAFNSLEKALSIGKNTGNIGMIATVFQIKATIYYEQKKYDKAILEAKKAYDIYVKNEFKSNAIQTLSLLKDFYESNSDFEKAYETLDLFTKHKDSMNILEFNEDLLNLRLKYESTEKELKIKEQNLEIAKKESQKNIFIIIASSLAIIALLLLFVYFQTRKTQQQKIINLENEKENIALKSLIAGEEKERSRIAKELHDGIGSLLAASKMHASKLLLKNPETDPTLLNLLDSASKETRRISHNLLPESLMNKGLDVALQDFISSINESQLLNANYQSINLSGSLPQPLQLSIYRIVQELINNIIKHSEATEALVQLNQNKSKLIITVEDNGKGFSFDKSKSGIGLQNIKSRLSLLKGKMEVDSNESMGTSVYIEFELEK